MRKARTTKIDGEYDWRVTDSLRSNFRFGAQLRNLPIAESDSQHASSDTPVEFEESDIPTFLATAGLDVQGTINVEALLKQKERGVCQTKQKKLRGATISVWDLNQVAAIVGPEEIFVSNDSVCVFIFSLSRALHNPLEEIRQLVPWIGLIPSEATSHVFLVGTHYDSLKEELGNPEELNLFLEHFDSLLAKMLKSHNVDQLHFGRPQDTKWSFFLSETTKGSNCRQSFSVQFSKSLECLSDKNQIARSPNVKLGWFYLLWKFQHQQENQLKYSTKSKFVSFAKKYKEDDPERVLLYFDSIGEIIFRDNEESDDVIILDPEWFYDMVNRLHKTKPLEFKGRRGGKKTRFLKLEKLGLFQRSRLHQSLNIDAAADFIQLCVGKYLLMPCRSKNQELFFLPYATVPVASNKPQEITHSPVYFYLEPFKPQLHAFFRMFVAELQCHDEWNIVQYQKCWALFKISNKFNAWIFVDETLSRMKLGMKKAYLQYLPNYVAIAKEAMKSTADRCEVSCEFNLAHIKDRFERLASLDDAEDARGNRGRISDTDLTYEDLEHFFDSKIADARKESFPDHSETHYYDAFLSHSWGNDGEVHHKAKMLHAQLQSADIQAFLDENEMKQSIQEEMYWGVTRSTCFIAFLNEKYLEEIADEKSNCGYEFSTAILNLGPARFICIDVNKDEPIFNTALYKKLIKVACNNPKVLDFRTEKSFQENLPALVASINQVRSFLLKNNGKMDTKKFYTSI